MTEKRFYVDKSRITHLYVPYDKEHEFVFEGVEKGSTIMKLVGLLNNALEENEQLKKELESFKPIIFESDGKQVTLYKKGDVE